MRVLSVSGVETINDTTLKHNVYFYEEKTGVLVSDFLVNSAVICYKRRGLVVFIAKSIFSAIAN